ncbi:transcription factor SCREAM2 isoform X2 [Brachypodium distachyon]|uniref:BHLH domain-containing protein n=1 Tax=Brachypodium distachyon TaxID=15368 RepID=A0A0Q3ELE2_BRADI|nr:transcription factor SCREAM2 isoform X2 [Brachypodium distachyon]KQJ88406.1 hypothetical protein BRADI_4g17460v3 [Brachypodium distachyon]|eukprot:XP_014757473.1 transcription factor SCREAM2 isoform X2 [Brachypodium distachyon]
MLSGFNSSLWMQEEHDGGQDHQPAGIMGMIPMLGMEGGNDNEQEQLLAMASGAAGGEFRVPGTVTDDWLFGGAPGSAAMYLGPPAPPEPQGASSSSGFGVASQTTFPIFNLGGAGPFDVSGFDLGNNNNPGAEFMSFLGAGNAASTLMPNSSSLMQPAGNAGSFFGSFAGFGTAPAPQMPADFASAGFDSFQAPPLAAPALSAPFSLRPLEVVPTLGAQPTLFQKRALLRRNAGLEDSAHNNNKKRQAAADTVLVDADEEEDDVDVSIDASGLNYDDSEDGRGVEESGRDDGKESNNANSRMTTGGGAAEGKGKKSKGMPAKNLMAERRRRKKLNDRLYMLRSVVPRISKMDRASILGDAIEYLKELLKKINDLQNELESSPTTSSMPLTPTSFHPPTPTLPTLPSRVKEELYPSALPSPTGQQPMVQVRLREGEAYNIHMLCARRPGLLHSTLTAIDSLNLDVQQAVISCFNGFVMDVFKAEVVKDAPLPQPDQIKAVLLQVAGFHPMI